MLVKPVLYKINAFDAQDEYEILFSVNSGNQVVANEVEISTNGTVQEVVYNSKQSTYSFKHTLASGILTNGEYYSIRLKTFDTNDNESVWSDSVTFRCYTTPVFYISNMPTTNIITSSNYEFNLTYYQAEGESLKNLEYTLLDNNDVILSTSGVLLANDETNFSYKFSGFLDNEEYQVQVDGTTIEGTVIDTYSVSFSVNYIAPSLFATLDLQNDCNDGLIDITSNIITIEGTSSTEPPIYIDNTKIDVTGDNEYVYWDKGFSISDDFVTKIHVSNFPYYKNLVFMEYNISLQLMENEYKTKDLLILNVYKDSGLRYTIYSNEVDIVDTNNEKYIYIQRINNVYKVYLENME